jgi:ribosomal protein L7/L12
MTSNVVMTAWAPGLNKVALTKALQAHCGLGLAEAKRLTDQLLDGHFVSITFANADAATFLDVLEKLGVVAKLSADDAVPQRTAASR